MNPLLYVVAPALGFLVAGIVGGLAVWLADRDVPALIGVPAVTLVGYAIAVGLALTLTEVLA